MYVALERYLSKDHDKEWKTWEAGIAHIENSVKNINGVTTSITVPKLGNVTPNLNISWDENKIKITAKQLQENLRNGNPSIETGGGGRGNSIGVTVWMLKPGEEKIVAGRIREEFSKAVV